MKYLLNIWILVLLGSTCCAQTLIEGSVFRNDTKEPIEGCTVLDPSSGNFSYTDENGKFSIDMLGDTMQIWAFQYQSISIDHQSGIPNIIYLHPLSVIFDQHVEIMGSRHFLKAGSTGRLDKNMIPINQPNALASSINSIPGILMHSATLNTNRITIRGIGNRSLFATSKIKAYLADIPLTSGIGESTVEDLDFHILKAVEVFKGPTASRYGAGLGGLIQFKPDLFSAHSGSGIEFIANTGSYGQLNLGKYLNLRNVDKGMSLLLGYNYLKNDGYRENNEYQRNNFSALAQWIGDKHQFHLIGNFINLKAFIPSSINFPAYRDNPRSAAANWNEVMGFEDYDKILLGISHRYEISPSFYTVGSIHVNTRDSYESRPFDILYEKSVALGARIKMEVLNLWNGRSEIHFGIEAFKENYDWSTFETLGGDQGMQFSDFLEDRRILNLFAEKNYRLSRSWNFELGLNLNKTSYLLEDIFEDGMDLSGDYSFETILSPRLGISFSPEVNRSYFIAASHGFSAPTVEETLTPEGEINPDIQPERGWNFELGTKSKSDRLSYEFAIYTMRVSDLLVARRTDFDQYTGLNAGKTRHDGLEALISWNFLQLEQSRLNATLGYQFSDYTFVEFLDEDEDHSGNKLTGTPPHLLTGMLQASIHNWHARFVYRFTDRMPLRDDNALHSESSQVVDFIASYKSKLGEKFEFKIQGQINNLLNEKYASMYSINAPSFGGSLPRYYYPGLPRHFYLSTQLRYAF